MAWVRKTCGKDVVDAKVREEVEGLCLVELRICLCWKGGEVFTARFMLFVDDVMILLC
jgi:hypothetical protein